MVYSLPGVTVSCNKSPVVKIIPRDDDHRDNCRYEWIFTVTFEVKKPIKNKLYSSPFEDEK